MKTKLATTQQLILACLAVLLIRGGAGREDGMMFTSP